MKFIPVSEPLFIGNEKKYLLKCLSSGFISSSGKFVVEFEKKFAKFLNRKYAISVSNGTAALQIAYDSLKLKKKDEIILPSFTIISCILPVVRHGAKPVLVDSCINSWNMNIDEVEQKITPKTKCIIAPHIYGLPLDMTRLEDLAKKHKLKIIEDAAEVLGQTFNGKKCGSFGNISTFSFYANKQITTGEGGMIVTDNQTLATRCRALRNLYFNDKRRFLHHELGWNHRFTNLQAAIGLAQLEKIIYFIKKKRKIGETYNHKLIDSKYFFKPKKLFGRSKNIYWIYGIVLKKNSGKKLSYIMKALKKMKIETRNFFWPLHKQPILLKIGLFKNERYPVAEYLANNGFYIPSGLGLNKKNQSRVIGCINKIFKSK